MAIEKVNHSLHQINAITWKSKDCIKSFLITRIDESKTGWKWKSQSYLLLVPFHSLIFCINSYTVVYGIKIE